jgi:hypothetical protein
MVGSNDGDRWKKEEIPGSWPATNSSSRLSPYFLITQISRKIYSIPGNGGNIDGTDNSLKYFFYLIGYHTL